jgi:2-oxoacid:acceptor oxidoreductase, beta subunit, pyruvate/2-ketoisovalerate family
MVQSDFKSADPIAWCPGCGDFGILSAVQKALVRLEKQPRDVLLVSGIGQAAKLPHYVNANCFNGLHGRALPAATGAKIANRALTVIVTTGDGDCYGEGGNHFIHAIRRNPDITVIVHDNQVYGLTKGQASPTTEKGYVTKVQTKGVALEPFKPLEIALSLGCGFVARGFANDIDHLADLVVQGVHHTGFSLIDVLQPCVSFNRLNTQAWYKERVYKLDSEAHYDPTDFSSAFSKAREWGDRIPLGVIYRNEKPSYEDLSGLSALDPLVEYEAGAEEFEKALKKFR